MGEGCQDHTPAAKQRGSGKGLKIPMPDEEYIREETKATHSKSIQMSSKASKIKAGFDLGKAAGNLDMGGFALNDPFFKGSGSALVEAASVGNMSLSPDAKMGSSLTLQQALGVPEKPGPDEEKEKKKKKKYDLLAAKNRCRVKLGEDMKKINSSLGALVEESEKLLVEHAQSQEYACYVETLKQRLTLVYCACATVGPRDVANASAIEKVVRECLKHTAKQEFGPDVSAQFQCLFELQACLKGFHPDEDIEAEQAGLAEVVAKVGVTFTGRSADGDALTAHGRLLPVSKALLDAGLSGYVKPVKSEVQAMLELLPEFLADHLSDCLLAAAMDGLQSMPLDDVSKLKPLRLMERSLVTSLENASDEDWLDWVDWALSLVMHLSVGRA